MLETKEDIQNKVVRILEKKGFENLIYEGCFDILAKGERFLAIKTLKNVDALSEETATNLKTFSYFFSANALMVSVRSNHGELEKNVVYSRFNIPIMTPELFEMFVENDWIPSIFSIKGKYTVEINTKLLEKERLDKGLSLESLSNKIDISKKSLYEIENKRVRPTLETVRKLQEFFGTDLISKYELEPTVIDEEIKPQTQFQKKISVKFDEFKIEHSSMTSSPFEIVGKKNKPIVTSLTEVDVNFELKTRKLSQLLAFTDILGIFILKKMEQENIHGIPVLLDSEIDELENYRDFYKLVKERS